MTESPIFLGLKIKSNYINNGSDRFYEQYNYISNIYDINKIYDINNVYDINNINNIYDINNVCNINNNNKNTNTNTNTVIDKMSKNIQSAGKHERTSDAIKIQNDNKQITSCCIIDTGKLLFSNFYVEKYNPQKIKQLIILNNENKYLHFIYDKISMNINDLIYCLKNVSIKHINPINKIKNEITIAIKIYNIEIDDTKIIYVKFDHITNNVFNVSVVQFDKQFESIIGSYYYNKFGNKTENTTAFFNADSVTLFEKKYDIDELIIFEENIN